MKKSLIALSVLAITLLGAQSAQAALVTQLKLTDGVNTVIISDGGLGDVNGTAGVIAFSGAVGNWIVNVTTGIGSGLLGPGSLDLNSVDVAVGATAPLTVQFSQTGNDLVLPGWTMDFGGTINAGGSVTYSAYADNSNTMFGTALLIGTLGPYTSAAFSGSTQGLVTVTNPYTLTQQLVITRSPGTGSFTFSGDASLSPVPEPGTLVLLGGGLIGLAALARRRMRKS